MSSTSCAIRARRHRCDTPDAPCAQPHPPPRSTSLVPPRSVNTGECSRAVASKPRSRGRSVSAVDRSIRSATSSTESCSKRVPRSLTSAAWFAASLPVGQRAGHRYRQLTQRDHPGHQIADVGGRAVVDVRVRASARMAAKISVAVDRIRSGPLRSKPSSAVTWCQPLPTSPEHVGVGRRRRRRR